MDTNIIMDFLSNFGLVRGGSYDVPRYVVSHTLNTFLESGSLQPLEDYEQEIYIKWTIGDFNDPYKQQYLNKTQIEFLERHLMHKTYWACKDEDVSLYNAEINRAKRYYEWFESSERIRQKACTYTANKKVRKQVFDRDGKVCKKCGAIKNLSLDHIKPVSKGGENSLDNLQVLCKSCNSKKGAKYEG